MLNKIDSTRLRLLKLRLFKGITMKNIKKIYMYKLALGVIILLAGIIAAICYKNEASVSSFLIIMGLVLFVLTAFRLFRQGDLPDRDERTKKTSSLWNYLFLASDIGTHFSALFGKLLQTG